MVFYGARSEGQIGANKIMKTIITKKEYEALYNLVNDHLNTISEIDITIFEKKTGKRRNPIPYIADWEIIEKKLEELF